MPRQATGKRKIKPPSKKGMAVDEKILDNIPHSIEINDTEHDKENLGVKDKIQQIKTARQRAMRERILRDFDLEGTYTDVYNITKMIIFVVYT